MNQPVKPTLCELYNKPSKPLFSVEFFPPKTAEGVQKTKDLMAQCSKLPVSCMTVTYGAGGGTSAFSIELAAFIQNELPQTVVSHLTCFSHTQEELIKVVGEMESRGIENFLVLRGDKTASDNESKSFSSATEFVRFLKNREPQNKDRSKFSIAVAGYPEPHRESLGHDADYLYLREKVDAGASVIFTQLFFEPAIFLKYVDECRRYGINISVIPGIMPIFDFQQIKKITSLCGVSFPQDLVTQLEKFQDDKTAMSEIGTEYAIRQVQTLLKEGVEGIHLYAFNKLDQIQKILGACGAT